MSDKRYKIPEELKQKYLAFVALKDLRDKYIEKKKGYDKAVKAAKESEYMRAKFWDEIRILFPELYSDKIRLDTNTWEVYKLEEIDE